MALAHLSDMFFIQNGAKFCNLPPTDNRGFIWGRFKGKQEVSSKFVKIFFFLLSKSEIFSFGRRSGLEFWTDTWKGWLVPSLYIG